MLRRLSRSALVRHGLMVILSAGLVLLFAAVHGEWSPMHRWNRALADASLVLIALSMGLGPIARLFRPALTLLPYRRESGIYGCLLALAHAAIILVGWVEWDLMRMFGFEWHPELLRYVMFQHGFGLANAIGIAALLVAILLAATSSDVAMRRLGVSGWKFLQMGVLPLWWLSVAHVAYFVFMHFLSFHQATPEPNPLQYWFVGLVVLVLVLRLAAYLKTIGGRRKPDSPDEGAKHAPI
ncbi:MAG: hypothetical protein B7Z10_01340 [Rhodobacterales bacterium 32-66-7]|nr:MAG: hypothetical protein B7Z31_01315 [Rhodobacterales bacterium 12-65-15]OYX27086.1 MAG: hypothetical protein B7Z10_01340 [Rhodobacterales bacterium 32-66-7]